MSFTVLPAVMKATTSKELEVYRTNASSMRDDRDLEINTGELTDEGLEDLRVAASAVNDSKTHRALESLIQARKGEFGRIIPNFKAFQGVLEAYLKQEIIDGWIYVTGPDDKVYPELVTTIHYDDGKKFQGKDQQPSVTVRTLSCGYSAGRNGEPQFGVITASHTFTPQMAVKKRIADILAAEGINKETASLREAHNQSLKRHYAITQNAFAEQFRINGRVYQFEEMDYRRRGSEYTGRRAVHDLQPKHFGPVVQHAESELFDDEGVSGGQGKLPEHSVVRLFDLRTQEFIWVHPDNLTPYEYDSSLREKLILPESHRDLLDVLTSNLDAFVNDIIEGKSAGNVILCKGVPGVGKTLTAEVYAELTKRPLYAIHSGSLGTTAKEIQTHLQDIFTLAKRWSCVLLLDEADVFIKQRGDNIEQNAIVAEFLRTLEYFDGLLFMTTNRPDDIDDAIISRCAAIIDYAPPSSSDAAAIWGVMAEQFGSPLDKGLIAELVQLFPDIAPRDIKMLFRLALRVSAANEKPVTQEVFRKCAMFRAIKMNVPGEARSVL